MLNCIKSMIKEKNDFLEAAAIIFEDGSGTNLDDVIVLGEEGPAEIPLEGPTPIVEGDDDDESKDGKKDDDDDHDDDHDEPNKDDGDIMSQPIDDEPIDSSPVVDPGDDVLDTDIDSVDDNPSVLGSDLPEPIGAQTGEPINPDDDILNVEIDLGSNTVKDILPVPPANAAEALGDGADTQRVDSGFGNDEGITEATKENEKNLKKEIIFKNLLDLPKELQSAATKVYNKLMEIINDLIFDEDDFKTFKKFFPELKKNFKFDISSPKSFVKVLPNGEYTGYITITCSDVGDFRGNLSKMLYKIAPNEEKIHKELNVTPGDLWKKMVLRASKEVNRIVKDQFDFIDDFGVDTEHLDNFGMNLKDSYVKKTFFSEESEETTKKNNVKPVKESANFWDSFFNPPDTSYTEAITLGGEPAPAAAPAAEPEPTEEAPPVDDPTAVTDPAEAPAAESDVTSAVRDKVSEAETEVPVGGNGDGKEALLKKLGTLTKGLEDAKKAVMDTIQ